jgi:uncharacterized protein (TIGR02118 family)
MIKVVYCFQKRPGMSHEDFDHYWRDVHGQIGARIPGLRRLVQSRAVRLVADARQPDFDGVAELWFDDEAALMRARASEEWKLSTVDEHHFLDPSSILYGVTEERTVFALSDEHIEVEDIDERLVRQSIELARGARQAGNHPFGALLALNGAVLVTAQNTIATDRDPTAHAESNLVAEAIRRLPPEQIRRSVLYSSCEPCAMCAAKMYWAGIRFIVYALPAELLGSLAGRSFIVPCRELFARSADAVRIVGPMLVDEARAVHVGFWPSTGAA